ncbi:hypothetical protein [Mesorhizobium cantuariense]|uniref:Uncharacterized protein n=1 Tax=Mesorhizobium cantuariense TaxID=1300275 RepID=A0ABV7MPZ4_9HYPH
MAIFLSLVAVLMAISYFAGLKVTGFLALFSAVMFGLLIFSLLFPDRPKK